MKLSIVLVVMFVIALGISSLTGPVDHGGYLGVSVGDAVREVR